MSTLEPPCRAAMPHWVNGLHHNQGFRKFFVCRDSEHSNPAGRESRRC